MTPIFALLLLQAGKAPTASVKLAATTATVGQTVKGTLTLTFPEGLHGYQNPPADEYENPIKVSVVDKNIKLTKVDYPKGVETRIAGADKPSLIYEGSIQIPFTLVAGKPTGKTPSTNISIKVDYQLCSMSNCWPPASFVVKAPLKVVAKK